MKKGLLILDLMKKAAAQGKLDVEYLNKFQNIPQEIKDEFMTQLSLTNK